LGYFAEEFVSNFLESNGYKIIARNYQKKFGEIDIIVQKNEVIAFVEVKARKQNYFGLSEVITRSKQKKIILTAKDFLMNKNFVNKIFRFDIALLHNKGNTFEIQYIKNAFSETN